MIAPIVLAALTFSPADLVVKNAVVWSDGMTGFASFIAIDESQFVYVGKPEESFIGPDTVVVDAGGRVVVPGLIDSHVHMLSGGASLTDVQLRDARDRADFIARLKAYAEANPKRKWITGGRWSTESWADKTEPTKEWLDEAVPNRPVFLSRMDGHSAVANSMALRLASITRDTKDPADGRIVRDADGEPTGLLRETATGFVSRFIPAKSIDELKDDLRAAMRHANANGITAVSDIPASGLNVYTSVAEETGLTVRFGLYPILDEKSIPVAVDRFEGIEDWLQLKGIKVYMDGSLGSRTAYMAEPFLNNPADGKNNRGLPRKEATDGTIQRIAALCAADHLQLIGHAIGDMANHLLLGFFKDAWTDVRSARPRLEHAQHLLPADIPEIGRLGVITSMQPFHKADDGRYAESYIGPERAKTSYAYKDILDSGGILAFGSDWPVVTINPFLGIETAVTGKTLAGTYWQTQNNISVYEALRGYTSSGAYAMFWEDRIGRIAPGYLADFVILSDSPFGPKPNWDGMHPVATYVGGKKVYGDRPAVRTSPSPARELRALRARTDPSAGTRPSSR